MYFSLSSRLSDHVLDEGTFDPFIPALVKAAAGGPNKGRNVSHVTQDSTYKYVQDHKGTLYRGGQTAFLPARLQHLKKFLSCHMKPIKNIYFLPSKEKPQNLPQLSPFLPTALFSLSSQHFSTKKQFISFLNFPMPFKCCIALSFCPCELFADKQRRLL